MICAKYKSNKTTTATEATAIAIHDVTPSNQNNMVQQNELLIGKAIYKKLTSSTSSSPSPSSSSQKMNNSQDSKIPHTPILFAKNEKGGKKRFF